MTARGLGAAGSEASTPGATLPELVRRALVATRAKRSGSPDLARVRQVLTPAEHDLWMIHQSPRGAAPLGIPPDVVDALLESNVA